MFGDSRDIRLVGVSLFVIESVFGRGILVVVVGNSSSRISLGRII